MKEILGNKKTNGTYHTLVQEVALDERYPQVSIANNHFYENQRVFLILTVFQPQVALILFLIEIYIIISAHCLPYLIVFMYFFAFLSSFRGVFRTHRNA